MSAEKEDYIVHKFLAGQQVYPEETLKGATPEVVRQYVADWLTDNPMGQITVYKKWGLFYADIVVKQAA